MTLVSKPKIKIAERTWYDVYYAPFELSRRPKVFITFDGDPVPFLQDYFGMERDRIDAMRGEVDDDGKPMGKTGQVTKGEPVVNTEVIITHDCAAAMEALLKLESDDPDLNVKVPLVLKIWARGIVEELENMTNGKDC